MLLLVLTHANKRKPKSDPHKIESQTFRTKASPAKGGVGGAGGGGGMTKTALEDIATVHMERTRD